MNQLGIPDEMRKHEAFSQAEIEQVIVQSLPGRRLHVFLSQCGFPNDSLKFQKWLTSIFLTIYSFYFTIFEAILAISTVTLKRSHFVASFSVW